MSGGFMIMERHLDAARPVSAGGRLILSRLQPGRSVIGSDAPSLKLVISGEELYDIDGRAVRVTPGQFLYLGPGVPCLGTNKVETVGLCLSLPTDGAPSGTDAIAGHDPVLGRSLVLSTRTSGMGRALDHYARIIANDPECGERLAGEIIGAASQAVEQPLASSRAAIEALAAAKRSTRHALFQRLERARGFLHAHDDRSVGLSELAAVANLSQFHLARFFRLAFGQPPIAYHRTLRLERAAGFLAREEGTLAEAAELAGYSDPVSLSHAFRRHFGVAPRGLVAERRASAAAA